MGARTYRVRSNWTFCEQGVGQEDLPPTPSKSMIQFAMQIAGKAGTSISGNISHRPEYTSKQNFKTKIMEY